MSEIDFSNARSASRHGWRQRPILHAERKRLDIDIEIDFQDGGRCTCPECGKGLHGALPVLRCLPAPGLPARALPACGRSLRVPISPRIVPPALVHGKRGTQSTLRLRDTLGPAEVARGRRHGGCTYPMASSEDCVRFASGPVSVLGKLQDGQLINALKA